MGVVINDSRHSLDDKVQIDVEISKHHHHHHHVLPPSLYSIDIIITIYSIIIDDDRRNVIGGKFGGSAEIEAVQKAANEKSLHQSKSRAQGVETRRASLDRDQLSHFATTVSLPNTTSPNRTLSLLAPSPLASHSGQWEAFECPSPHGNPSVKKQRP